MKDCRDCCLVERIFKKEKLSIFSYFHNRNVYKNTNQPI